MSTTTTFSDLLRSPNEVIERLDDGDVVLTRRGRESLRLSKERNAAEENELVAALARLIAVVVADDSAIDRVVESLRESFPWVDFLDDATAAQFVGDFLRTARACASVGRFERLNVEVANWRETAIAYSLGLQNRPNEFDYLPEAVEVEKPRAL